MLTYVVFNVTDLSGRSDSKYPNFYTKYEMFYIFHSVNYNSIITIQVSKRTYLYQCYNTITIYIKNNKTNSDLSFRNMSVERKYNSETASL